MKHALNTLTPPDTQVLRRIIATALYEDLGEGSDVTSELLIPKGLVGELQFNAREDMVACGMFIPAMVFEQLDSSIVVEARVEEGAKVSAGTTLVAARGAARVLLTGERVALNLMQRACEVATETRRYVDVVAGTKAVILDTRKTMPGLREIDKYAVRAGGGQNHRMGLYDMVLIKDNHIALAGNITEAVARAWLGTDMPVVVECDTMEQVKEALKAEPYRILLDNMTLLMMKAAVDISAGKVKLEASGGVTLKTLRDIAETGVDYISVGAITHSVPTVDIGADILLGE